MNFDFDTNCKGITKMYEFKPSLYFFLSLFFYILINIQKVAIEISAKRAIKNLIDDSKMSESL